MQDGLDWSTVAADDPERLLFDGNLGKQMIQAMHGHVRFQRLTEKEGGQYQRHVIQPRLRDNDGTTHVDRYCPAAVCQSRPAFAQ